MNIILSILSIIFSIVVMFFGWCIVLNVDRTKYLNLRGFVLILVGLLGLGIGFVCFGEFAKISFSIVVNFLTTFICIMKEVNIKI